MEQAANTPEIRATPQETALPAEIPVFEPVPRQTRRENGWSPARQRKFIEILSETASVRQAAMAVNMSRVSCYQLRNHPQGEEFKQAWDAALDAGVAFLKDIAFERAVNGELEPVWQRGVIKGYKRKYSNSLLMFLLRQYGQDDQGRRVTVNYVRTRAAVAAREGTGNDTGGAEAAAEATTMTVRASKTKASDNAKVDQAAAMIEQFSGVELDAEAEAEIARTLAACAARKRKYEGTDYDRDAGFIAQKPEDEIWRGNFEPYGGWLERVEPFDEDEKPWECIEGGEADLEADIKGWPEEALEGREDGVID